jgi:Fe-S-cluster containining protein
MIADGRTPQDRIMKRLFELQADIDARVQHIRSDRPEWPCARGCGDCCRQLAGVPRLTRAEWDLLCHLQQIDDDLSALATQPPGPVVCPLLDQASSVCPVYLQRPVACRTYGFYVQRGSGLYCSDIEARVAVGTMADVVWGNHDAIDHRPAALGETRTLNEWFADWHRPQSTATQPG